jgi:hypothetical protein
MRGTFTLVSCALKEIIPEVWDMFRWVLRAHEGKGLPEDGGLLSQSQSFLEAWDFQSRDMQEYEAHRR